MAERPVREPTAAHPITVTPTAGRVVVRVNGQIVADTTAAVALQESTYPAVQYIPLEDVQQQFLTRTDTSTYCPYKGDASYYSVTAAGSMVEDAIWSYEQPYPAVSQIAGRIAFYPDKAEISVTPG
jgi:uncharacterized protein (DUF427 family)